MKKKISIFSVAWVIVMSLASCTSDNENENDVTPNAQGLIPVEIRSGINGGRTKLNGDGKTVEFQSGDSLAVWDADKHEFTTTGSGSIAVFKGTLNTSTPTGQTLNILYPYSAGQDCDGTTITAEIPTEQTATEGTFDPKANLSVATADYVKGQNVTCTLQNVCGLLRFTIADDADIYDSIKVCDAAESDKKAIAGTVTINPSAENPAVSGGTAAEITLKGALTKGSTYYIALKPETFSADGLVMTFYKGTENVGEAKIAKKDGITPLSITPGVILDADEVKPDEKPAPKPIGKFTINSNDDEVSFAWGNLYCTRAGRAGSWTYSFAFEAKQWDYRTCNFTEGGDEYKGVSSIGGLSGDTPENTSGLFQWIKSGITDAVATGCFGAFSILTEDQCKGNSSDTLFADWGASIDGSKWRTLSNAEWDYLLNRKVMVKGYNKISYGKGTVNGIKGLIILPDDWDGSVYDFYYGSTSFNNNTFNETPSPTKPTWSQMESAGCVFLPCAGGRSGGWVSDASNGGHYWSSSPYALDVYYACYVYFDSSSSYPQNLYGYRHLGYSVRLACPYE